MVESEFGSKTFREASRSSSLQNKTCYVTEAYLLSDLCYLHISSIENKEAHQTYILPGSACSEGFNFNVYKVFHHILPSSVHSTGLAYLI